MNISFLIEISRHMLDRDWLVTPVFDFEYKKYILLDYFQKVNKHLSEFILFPVYRQLVWHRKHLQALKNSKELLEKHCHRELSNIDIKNVRLKYEYKTEIDESTRLIESLIAYSLPHFKRAEVRADRIRRSIESAISISQIGIVPIYRHEGYLLVNNADNTNADIFRYRHDPICNTEDAEAPPIAVDFIDNIRITISNTYEGIKSLLIKEYPELPNPATWLVLSERQLPLYESLLPVALPLLANRILSY